MHGTDQQVDGRHRVSDRPQLGYELLSVVGLLGALSTSVRAAKIHRCPAGRFAIWKNH